MAMADIVSATSVAKLGFRNRCVGLATGSDVQGFTKREGCVVVVLNWRVA
jgi:hypothetical protein